VTHNLRSGGDAQTRAKTSLLVPDARSDACDVAAATFSSQKSVRSHW
jgi:hypothetical protein